MSEKLDNLTSHPHATYAEGLRDLAAMSHVSSEISDVLCDCANLIDKLASRPTQPADAVEERKAIVEWLNNYDPQLADAIERGDHLKAPRSGGDG